MSSLEAAKVILDIADKWQFYFSIFLLFIGMISNILLISIFTTLRIFRDNRSAYYLVVESTTNIGLLLTLLPSNIVGYNLGQNPANLSVVWCKIQLMGSYGFGMYSLFTICFLALDQYLSTNHRQSWRQISTIKLAHHLTFFNISFVLFHGILFLIFGDIGSIGCTIYQPIAKLYFIFFFYPILTAILPMSASTLFSLLAYRNVRRIVRRQIPLTRRRLDREMTAIALARVICIVITGLPFIACKLLNLTLNYTDNDYLKMAIVDLSIIICNTLLNTNFSVS